MAMDQQSGTVPAGLYGAFRDNGAPTYYGEVHSPWHADILESGFIFAGCILAVAFFSILPGIHGKSRWFTLIWIVLGVSVGTSILVVNYSAEWETAEVVTETKYKAGTGKDIQAKVGVHIGLRGINVTLKGEPVEQLNETINYNEHFSWSWRQGRIGFGPFASQFNQEYRAAQFRGLPLPILWIAEYFTLDGEGIRWGRFYREAGLFAHMCLWLALAFWVLANIMLFMLLRYGAYLIILTGLSMCTSSVIKHYIRNPLDLSIPFSAEHILVIHYGAAFWLCLVIGIMCIVFGLVVLILDLRLPAATASFFGMDILQDEKLLQTEHSSLSRNSDATNASTSTNNSDLTEIVEVDRDGKVIRKIDVRPAGAPKNGSYVRHYDMGRGRLDDVLGDEANSWTDCSSDSELEPTDDEWEEPSSAPVKRPGSRGFVQRFQARRRVPSAKPARTRRTRVSPTEFPRWKN
ncbi:dual oxidase maturation factor 1-like [Mercenaria mercenaria]|uniref:dual oxidase maturation factor 1-like n=1 Tax=Mercenaria mercenaria TaxID=6596 RepID=UPI00234F427D|nr:dual oxidase maturation factor 1-like [Mercenaria mercenaria]